jgi:predicted  nucleic acid-binding Zn-ribbon protein
LRQTLYSLIELQEIDSKLDKVYSERGDLPRKVKILHDVLEDMEKKLFSQKGEINKLKLEEKKLELDVGSMRAQLTKYENQLYQVKTNREYDAIANETENVKSTINDIENRILEIEESIEKNAASNESIEQELINIKKEFEENSAELQEKISSSSEEENILNQERDIVEQKLTSQQMKTYERIRIAKKGMAVAYCNGGVCSGCYSFIPPQKVVEIRNMKRLYHCESCGRILVWDKNIEE